ncbi:flavoprotein [Termitidicoccus mucosus]|uniref:Flavoprotein n=2 Tax=Termitidicoccus mucosus TaxID=1184151 RepID=A0A178IF46_9BACT|nr:flavoprotein [Opitutaceae bacterium TSB47]
MMIEIICGTNRPGSNTRKVASQIEAIYHAQGTPASLLDLAELPPAIFDPASYAEKPAAFGRFRDRVLAADGLVIVTPEYNGGAPGVLKYFIDMLPFPESLARKPLAFVGVAAGAWGALRPVEHLLQIAVNLNAHVYPGRVLIPGIFQALDESGRLKNADLVKRLEEQARGFAEFAARHGRG